MKMSELLGRILSIFLGIFLAYWAIVITTAIALMLIGLSILNELEPYLVD